MWRIKDHINPKKASFFYMSWVHVPLGLPEFPGLSGVGRGFEGTWAILRDSKRLFFPFPFIVMNPRLCTYAPDLLEPRGDSTKLVDGLAAASGVSLSSEVHT